MSAIAFLGMNDVQLTASEDDLVDLVVGVTEKRVSKAVLAVFLEHHTSPW